jgi:hypothetical protein
MCSEGATRHEGAKWFPATGLCAGTRLPPLPNRWARALRHAIDTERADRIPTEAELHDAHTARSDVAHGHYDLDSIWRKVHHAGIGPERQGPDLLCAGGIGRGWHLGNRGRR